MVFKVNLYKSTTGKTTVRTGFLNKKKKLKRIDKITIDKELKERIYQWYIKQPYMDNN